MTTLPGGRTALAKDYSVATGIGALALRPIEKGPWGRNS